MDTRDYINNLINRKKGRDVSLGHIQAYYFEETSTLVIEGSNDVKDWITSLKLFPTKGADLTYHQGYYGAASMFFHHLWRIGINPQLIVGYSIGGAIAAVLKSRYYVKAEILTIGAPKYVRGMIKLEPKVTHYIIEEDWVTKLPFSYKREGRVVIFRTGIKNPFKAHKLETYLKELKKCGN